MKVLKLISDFLTSKFTKLQLMVIAALLVCAFILSDSNIFARMGYDSEIRGLKSQINYYKEKKEKDQRKLDELHSNKEDIEKFARENYKMRNDNEDVFIIE